MDFFATTAHQHWNYSTFSRFHRKHDPDLTNSKEELPSQWRILLAKKLAAVEEAYSRPQPEEGAGAGADYDSLKLLRAQRKVLQDLYVRTVSVTFLLLGNFICSP